MPDGLRNLRRQRAQVVSRPAGAGCGNHRRGFRRGRGTDGHPDRQHGQIGGLRPGILVFRADSGRHRVGDVVVPVPPPAELPSSRQKANSTRLRTDTSPGEMLSPVFYVLYVMLVLIAAGGLMAAADVAPDRQGLRIDKVPVDLFGLTMPRWRSPVDQQSSTAWRGLSSAGFPTISAARTRWCWYLPSRASASGA